MIIIITGMSENLLEVVISVGVGRVVEDTQGLGHSAALSTTAWSLRITDVLKCRLCIETCLGNYSMHR
jgi:hypothetical protein